MIKNYLYNLMYQMLIIILPIITIPYVSRVLGPEGVGTYALTNSYAQYFALLGMLGLSMYSSREVAYVRDDKNELSRVFWEVNLIRIITVGLSFLIYMFVFVFFSNSSYKLVYIIQALIILSYLVDISWLFIGLENFKKVVVRNTVVKIIGIILIFIFINDSSDVWLYTLILGGTQLIGQITMWIQLPKDIYFVIPKVKNLKHHLSNTMKLFIPQIAINVYTLLDKIMLGVLANEIEVGLYDNSQKMIKIVVAVVTTIAMVTLPRMANLYKNMQYDEFQKNVYKSFSFVSFLVFPMTFGLIGLTKTFVPWFYGRGFEGIVPMFYVGSFVMISLGWSSILGNQVLIATKKEKQFTLSVFGGALVNVILNFLLINNYGGVGTTVASVAAEFTGTLLMMYFLKDMIDIKKIFKPIYKYLVASFAMLCVIWIVSVNMKPTILTSFILLCVGVFMYIGIMFIIKDENLKLVLKVIKAKFN